MPPRDILSGFLAPDGKVSSGGPVGVAVGPDRSLLVADVRHRHAGVALEEPVERARRREFGPSAGCDRHRAGSDWCTRTGTTQS